MKKNEWNTKKSFELEEYSRKVRDYFSKMKMIRNDIRLDREDYSLNDEQKQKILIKLEILKSIEEYFNSDINKANDLNQQHQVFDQYNQLLKECYGKSIYEILDDVDIESKLKQLKEKQCR